MREVGTPVQMVNRPHCARLRTPLALGTVGEVANRGEAFAGAVPDREMASRWHALAAERERQEREARQAKGS
jgi:hypothetical protein